MREPVFDIIIYPKFVKIALRTWTVVDKIESELLNTAKCVISQTEVNKTNGITVLRNSFNGNCCGDVSCRSMKAGKIYSVQSKWCYTS